MRTLQFLRSAGALSQPNARCSPNVPPARCVCCVEAIRVIEARPPPPPAFPRSQLHSFPEKHPLASDTHIRQYDDGAVVLAGIMTRRYGPWLTLRLQVAINIL